jgi:hypothetical protein
MQQYATILCAAVCILSCAESNPNVRARRLPDKSIQVDGPLAGPYLTLEELATNACEIMTQP